MTSFWSICRGWGLQTFIISGNHDSAERLAFGGRLMEGSGIRFAPVFDAKRRSAPFEQDELGHGGRVPAAVCQAGTRPASF